MSASSKKRRLEENEEESTSDKVVKSTGLVHGSSTIWDLLGGDKDDEAPSDDIPLNKASTEIPRPAREIKAVQTLVKGF